MSRPALTCTRCGTLLPATAINTLALAPCPGCAARLLVAAFPAWLEQRAGQTGETLVLAADASCFYHDQKRARAVCEHCGRFLCALCDVEYNGAHLCPGCIATGHQKVRQPDFEHQRRLYDSLALGVAALPLLMWPVTILTAPVALFLVVRYWNAPGSLVRRGTRWRLCLAFVVALTELSVWGVVIFMALR